MKSKQLEQTNSNRFRRHSARLFNDSSLKTSGSVDSLNENDSTSSNYASACTSFSACSSSSLVVYNQVDQSTAHMTTTTENKIHITTNSNHQQQQQKQQTRNKASELYRTDYITAMKLDTKLLTEESIMEITDAWKQDWDKGIQVPNQKFMTKPNVVLNKNFNGNDDLEDEESEFIEESSKKCSNNSSFLLNNKYICSIDETEFDSTLNEPHLIQRVTNIQNRKLSDSLISISNYDYDETDDIWLTKMNEHLKKIGLTSLNHTKFEKIIQNFENQSYEMLKKYLDKLCSYKIEYDPSVVCDVCRSPDSDATNEIVFCDGCNVCVHQNCYGIETIPSGNWLCSACEYGNGKQFRPECVLCPNRGGALKPTKDFKQWCHVSCVLWTPEVNFGNTEKYEPVINITKIPAEKWSLKCSLCRYKKGCYVECPVNRCTNAFHITCAFKYCLHVNESTNDDDVIELSCFCKKHSKIKRNNPKSLNGTHYTKKNSSGQEDEEENENEVTLSLSEDISISEEKFHIALQTMNEHDRKEEMVKRLEILYQKFYNKVNVEKTINDLGLHTFKEQTKFVFNHWKLKRRFLQQPQNNSFINSRQDKPLNIINTDLKVSSLKNTLFYDIRHRLEYLRNLCFVIKKRERKKEKYNEINRRYFSKLTEYLEKYKTPNTVTTSTPNTTITANNNKTEIWSSCRIRDLFQTKNEKSIYDFPEKWVQYDQEIKNLLNLERPIKQEMNEDYFTNSCSSNSSSFSSSIISSSNEIEMIDQSSKTSLPVKRTIKTKSISSESNIKDISNNVLNNNNNTSNTNLAIAIDDNSHSKEASNNNNKFILSKCNENNIETKKCEKRLLRSLSVFQASSVSNDTSPINLENNNNNNDSNLNKTRLSLSLKKHNNSQIRTNANKLKQQQQKSNNNTDEHLTSLKNANKLKEDIKSNTTTTFNNNNSNNKKKRLNLDFPINSSLTKRHKPNEPPTQNSEHPTQQSRFNLRTKSFIEK